MRKWLVMAVIALAAGCSPKTETGYEPRKLGASDAVRRGYYAPPFSPAAEEAAADQGPDRRPGAWQR